MLLKFFELLSGYFVASLFLLTLFFFFSFMVAFVFQCLLILVCFDFFFFFFLPFLGPLLRHMEVTRLGV